LVETRSRRPRAKDFFAFSSSAGTRCEDASLPRLRCMLHLPPRCVTRTRQQRARVSSARGAHREAAHAQTQHKNRARVRRGAPAEERKAHVVRVVRVHALRQRRQQMVHLLEHAVVVVPDLARERARAAEACQRVPL
jgi:hypothetical protein